jgi:hypothetical protein
METPHLLPISNHQQQATTETSQVKVDKLISREDWKKKETEETEAELFFSIKGAK